jgi:hypothetical protein
VVQIRVQERNRGRGTQGKILSDEYFQEELFADEAGTVFDEKERMTEMDAIVGSAALEVRFADEVVARKAVFEPRSGLVVLVGENGQ